MKCRLCEGSALSLYYEQGAQGQFKFYKCADCRLVNLDLDGMDIAHNQKKYEYDQKMPDPIDQRVNRGSIGTYAYLKEKLAVPGLFIDIGCGNGALLYYARQDGWEVKGLEISEFLANEVKRKLDIDVVTVNFMDMEDFTVQYDLVTLRHVLEHIPDSKLALGKINKLLKPGGHAILEFPNIEGVSFKVKRFLEKTGVSKKEYDLSYRPGHCNEFSRRSFARLASVTNFEVVNWETYSSNAVGKVFNDMFSAGTKARVLIKKT